ncbi:MAG: Hpt domain-containing protein [Alphaproteobacteria bacterium]|nr:Hpt domain-containing protein [Alphaproteobacteria bacterium]
MAVVDLDQLRLMTGGDAGIAAEVLGIFRTQADMWGRLLDASGDAQQWSDACHTIKGAALSVGCFPLGEACGRAETLGRSGAASPAHTGIALSEVKDRLGEAVEAIARLEHRLMMTRDFDALRAE